MTHGSAIITYSCKKTKALVHNAESWFLNPQLDTSLSHKTVVLVPPPSFC